MEDDDIEHMPFYTQLGFFLKNYPVILFYYLIFEFLIWHCQNLFMRVGTWIVF